MITARTLSIAFLLNQDRILLMHRASQAKLFPGMWAPVGGHLEPSEINVPRSACLREIMEETNLSAQDLKDLHLRYIVHRRKADEIRTQYVYFGSSTNEKVKNNNEGTLHWVPLDHAVRLDTSATTRFILEPYQKTGCQTDFVYLGGVDNHYGLPQISWSALQDWE